MNDLEQPISSEKLININTKKNKYFDRFTVRDIVFLAIIGSVTIVTSLIMPLVLSVPIFGIAHIVTGLQMAILPTIGMYKVRKLGAFTLLMSFVSLYQIAMNPILFVSNILVALFIEFLVFIVFKGFKNNLAIFMAVSLYNPLTLPMAYVFQTLVLNNPGHWDQYIYTNEWITWVICIAVLLISIVGAWIGFLIAKEMTKAGIFKKFDRPSNRKEKK